LYFFGTKDIKAYVSKWIEESSAQLSGKTVIDVPAGNGVSTEHLHKVGANTIALDLFPEFFRVDGLICSKADLSETLPVGADSADFVLCQEGIEHVSDQLKCFRELSRILKVGGRLLVTTPNYSSIRSRVSYLLNESELMGKIMPPNEVDSVWFCEGGDAKMYFGHINLIGIQKLRLFGILSGLQIKKIHPNRVNYTALMMFPFLYPLIVYFSWAAFRRLKRKKGAEAAAKVKDCFALCISPRILLEGHLMVEFEKISPEKYYSSVPGLTAHQFVT
jgi:SAM-dependent methyltransferase